MTAEQAKSEIERLTAVINYHSERTILVYHEKYRPRFPKLSGTKLVYLTSSIGREYKSLYLNVAKHFENRPGVIVGCNPGSYQLKDGVKNMRRLLKRTNVLFLNREEARLLTGIKKEKNIRQLLDGMRGLGATIAVLTEGPKGSYVSDGKQYLKLGILEVPVIERTGCGDSYATAFMVALYHKQNLVEAMRWGTFNASSVLQHIGPQDGLLTLTKLRSLSRKYNSLVPRSF